MNAISFGWKVIIKSSRTFHLFVFSSDFTVYGAVLTGSDYALTKVCACARVHKEISLFTFEFPWSE